MTNLPDQQRDATGMVNTASDAIKPQLLTQSTMSREVEVVAYEDNGHNIVWVANLTCDKQSIEIEGVNLD